MKICPKCQSTYPQDYSICPRDGVRLAVQFTGVEAHLAAQLACRFRLLHRLGKGGFGTVYLAEQIAVGNRLVALKVLNGQHLDHPKDLKRFQDEAASAGRIHHPNVVTIHDYGQADDGTPYIAMEFLTGESLRDALQQRGRFAVREVAEILQQAARGLNAAHKLGIIHRDLKPENIFLARDDEDELIVKIVDFGIVKLLESADPNVSTGFLGTPPYMSFEQASGVRSDHLDARSDVYSLGIVVYEMLSGSVPFSADSPVGYFDKHRNEEPPPFQSVAHNLGVPSAVENVVMKSLVKDRDKRYASTLDFAREMTIAALSARPDDPPVKMVKTLTAPAPEAEIDVRRERTMNVSMPQPKELFAPTRQPSGAPAPVDVTVEVPSLARTRTIETPNRLPQGSTTGSTPIRQVAVAQPPQFRTISEPSSTMKFVSIGVVALILIVGGAVYFSRSDKPVLPVPDAIPPVTTQSVVSSPVSHRTTPVHPDTQDHLPARPAAPLTGHLRISCDRPCRLRLDGALQGEIESGRPTDLSVSNGRHVVEAAVTDESGIAAQQRQIAVYSGATQAVGFSFSSELASRRRQIAEGLRRAKADEQNLDIRKALDECNQLEKLDKDNPEVKNLRQELLNLCADHPDFGCAK